MDGQFKFSREIENFRKVFATFRDQKIVLYGTGRMTATLLQGLEGFQIIGLCDRDQALCGTMMYDRPILTRGQVERQADILIINTGESYWTTIYTRIQDWNIPIYFTNGQQAKLPKTNEVNFPYWRRSYEELRKKIEESDIVSFDIFDTLIMRQTFLPVDVYRLTEARLNKQAGRKTHFTEIRQRAVDLLSNPTLQEIYGKMAELLDTSAEELEVWQAIELETDKALLVGREDMIALCQETMTKKPVFFISDMHYTSDILQELLAQCGLDVKREQIFVSCEKKMSKENKDFWPYYKRMYVGDKNALHIGDDKYADICYAEEFGIRTYQVLSAMEILEHSSAKAIMPSIGSLYSSLAIGIVSARLFNSPFALNVAKGQIRFANEQEAGFCILGALLDSFMSWLLRMAQEKEIDTLVFFGRDGYLLKPIYEYFLSCDSALAPYGKNSVYLEISRSAVWSASIFNEEDIYEVSKFPFKGTFREFLQERYDVAMDPQDVGGDLVVSDLQNAMDVMKQRLSIYKEGILQQSAAERAAYRAYFSSLKTKRPFAVVDTMFHGTIQYYLSRILEEGLEGFYLCVYTGKDNLYLEKNTMYSCLSGNDGSVYSSFVYRQSEFIDAFFTAPVGMLKYIEADGNMVRAETMTNQEYFEVRQDMTAGIQQFIGCMRALQETLGIEVQDEDWADRLFGCFMDQGFKPSERIKQAFFFDNQVVTKREMAVWDG